MLNSDIVIRGAREHNLRNISISLPRNKLIVMTGVSGSGKSSLAFDTLYAEGQRRYVESLSTYARQFLGQMPKPEVDSISGLAPSISIQQKSTSRNPRSTVGTITEIFDYLRVLFARVGQGYCYVSGRPIRAQSTDSIIDSILTLSPGTRFQILAPIVQNQKGEFRDLFTDLLKRGHLRARVDGEFVSLADDLQLRKHHKHTIDVVIDRLVAGSVQRARLAESVELALRLADGKLIVVSEAPAADGASSTPSRPKAKAGSTRTDATEAAAMTATERLYSSHYACAESGMSYEPPTPQLFSFNSPLGMCPDCNGLGMRHGFPLEQLIVDAGKSIQKGAILLLPALSKVGRWPRHILTGAAEAIEEDCGLTAGTLLKTKWQDLPEKAQHLWLYGTGDRHITFTWRTRGGAWKHGGTWEGWVNRLLENYRTAKNPMRRRQLEKYMEVVMCSTCHGERLNRQARHVKLRTTSKAFIARIQKRLATGHVGDSEVQRSAIPPSSAVNSRHGKRSTPRITRGVSLNGDSVVPEAALELSLPQVCALSIEEAWEFFEQLRLDPTQQLIAQEALKEIRGRLGFLLQCGLHYLSLERSAPTLSGGESQRIRLAGQIGCGLVGVVYILDEPSIGLHPRDNTMLLESLQHLRDQGNTVIVVEHDEETMRAADHVVDFGPGPGIRGGEVVVEGTMDEVLKSARSITGQYLSGRLKIDVPGTRRAPSDRGELIVQNARHNNLKGITARFPLGRFICVTGVSGSGKSSLTNDILWQVINRDVNKGNGDPGQHDGILGLELLDKGIDIDQSPIGRTPRSNPATYVKVFDEIRDLFTKLPQSKMRGYKSGRFSFNVADGRCEACEGHGATKLEMDFLADIWVPCNVCEGRRFSHETLEVRFRDHSIADVLNLEIRDALTLFEAFPKITRLLQTLCDVGLDYMRLGQASPTLSGGEAQRVKLARELGKRSTGKTLYMLDEPTTGLHFADVHKLLDVLHNFVNDGNTVVVIEHNLDVIKTADWVIDIGPEGGAGGGEIVVEGTPEQIAMCRQSHTGLALRAVLPGLKPLRSKRQNESASRISRSDPFVLAERIQITGASEHNLQNISLQIPRGEMSVFCGPSGSGKTSLAMDTLYAEGQRRYVESLSAYARQFLGQMPKPRVDSIQGLSPAIAIEQKTVGATPRSTVGTVTEIYDYLRVLFARLGVVFCPKCEVPAEKQTTDEIVDSLLRMDHGTRLLVLAPVEVDRTMTFARMWERLQASGFARVRIDGTTYPLDAVPEMDHRRKHDVAVVMDRLSVDAKARGRMTDSVEAALNLGKGVLHVAVAQSDVPEPDWKLRRYSLNLSCPECQRAFELMPPQKFSFNSPLGWCQACEGLGTEFGANQALLITSPERSLLDGAVGVWPDPATNTTFRSMLQAMSEAFELPLDKPWYLLTAAQQRLVLYGNTEKWVEVSNIAGASTPDGKTGKSRQQKHGQQTRSQQAHSDQEHEQQEHATGIPGFRFRYRGLYPAIELASRLSYSHRRSLMEMGGQRDCSLCSGTRLQPEAAAVQLRNITLPQLCRMPLLEALGFLKSLKLSRDEKRIAGDLLNESIHRLNFLVEVGLDYLTMDRGMPTLSGGESQRIRLAGQIGRSLTGVLYVLDEPTIGLHPRDNGRLLDALRRLRDLGNTVLLVEHDREVLAAADHLYDFGPGAGRLGGNLVASGTPAQLRKANSVSLTGQYMSGVKSIPIPQRRRVIRREPPTTSLPSELPGAMPLSAVLSSAMLSSAFETPLSAWLSLLGASQHNLQNVDLHLPLGTLCCMTGVSGSGKSSLLMDTLARAVARRLNLSTEAPGMHRDLQGIEHLSKIVIVDQNPIGNTPASNPATYTGVFDEIRELFCRMPEAKVRGYKPGRFSFNRPGGRCEDCEGMGQQKIEMHFLPDVWVECPTCRGKRFNAETLGVHFNNCSIADVLEMPVEKALDVFQNVPRIRAPLATLNAIGLGYLTLGQSAPTLSGGEAQRLKLAAELAKPNRGRTIYLLDEPTTGLHFDDIAKLLTVLNSLVEQGNTVVVIEHNLDVIKTADWIVDIGPEAGGGGGRIVAQGTPEDLVDYAARWQEAAVNSNHRGASSSAGRRSQRSRVAAPAAGRLSPLRSWTGELLAPVMAQSEVGQIETLDVKALAKKNANDVSLEDLGKAAQLPWQVNGPQWHLVDRVSHSGAPCHWDGQALKLVVELLGKKKTLAPPVWNHRSTVEIKGREGLGWFLHARTGGQWLLVLCFRVKKNTFTTESLDQQLGLPPLDEMKEVPAYGREPRVNVRDLKTAWQEVTVKVWSKSEVQTPAFRQFLETATAAYVEQSTKEKASPEDLMPWKQLGRKWHLLRKSLPNNGRIPWEFDVIETLLPQVEQAAGDCDVDYGIRSKINWNRRRDGSIAAELHTKRADGVDLIVYCAHDAVTIGSIASLGVDQEIRPHRNSQDAVRIRFTALSQVIQPAVQTFLNQVMSGS